MIPAAPNGRGRFGRRRARAVTLIEILLALAILAAIMALAAPLALQTLRRRAFETAQSELLAAIDTARAHAQREGVVVELAVDATGQRLHASAWPLDGGEPRVIPTLRAELPATVRLAAGSAEDEGGFVAIFLPDGSAPISRTCVLRGDEGEEATVVVSGPLGQARVEARRAKSVTDDEADEADGGAGAGSVEPAPTARGEVRR